MDRSLLGDGVFRTLKVVNGKIRALQSHLQKLNEDAEKIFIKVKLPSSSELQNYVLSNGANKGTWRLKVSIVAIRNSLTLTWAKGKNFYSLEPYIEEKNPVKVGLFPEAFYRLNCKVKALSYLDQLSLLTWAKQKGYDEVLTTNAQDFLLEGATCNLIIWNKEKIFFVDPSLPYYEGLTQKRIMGFARKNRIDFAFCKIAPEALYDKCIYLCNSLKEIVPVSFFENASLKEDKDFLQKARDFFDNEDIDEYPFEPL